MEIVLFMMVVHIVIIIIRLSLLPPTSGVNDSHLVNIGPEMCKYMYN